jgi:hypothetical protein
MLKYNASVRMHGLRASLNLKRNDMEAWVGTKIRQEVLWKKNL